MKNLSSMVTLIALLGFNASVSSAVVGNDQLRVLWIDNNSSTGTKFDGASNLYLSFVDGFTTSVEEFLTKGVNNTTQLLDAGVVKFMFFHSALSVPIQSVPSFDQLLTNNAMIFSFDEIPSYIESGSDQYYFLSNLLTYSLLAIGFLAMGIMLKTKDPSNHRSSEVNNTHSPYNSYKDNNQTPAKLACRNLSYPPMKTNYHR